MSDTAAPNPRALIVAPEPTGWLRAVLGALSRWGAVEVFAPWALPAPLVALGRHAGFVRRRDGAALPGARGRGWFTVAELGLRTLARGRAAATFANRVRMRSLADLAAARRLSRDAPPLVIAPSFAARRTFAAAKRHGSTCLLLEDMPDFDGLVDGLDALARALPEAHFLRNHRPRPRDHARQRAERWQADAIAVRGRIAWGRLGAARPRMLLPRLVSEDIGRCVGGDAILFAGPPLARCGSNHLPALLDALKSHTIRVQPGPCSEPSTLLQHPRVHVRRGFAGVGAVLSIGPLESHPAAVAEALDRGVPIVGTLASTGLVDPTSMLEVDPRDGLETARALETALASGASPRPWSAPLTLATWLAQNAELSSTTA